MLIGETPNPVGGRTQADLSDGRDDLVDESVVDGLACPVNT